MIKFSNSPLLFLLLIFFMYQSNLNAMGFFTKVKNIMFPPFSANEMLIEGIIEASQVKVKEALLLKPDLQATDISSVYANYGEVIDNALNTSIIKFKINGKDMFPIIDLLIESGADINRKGAQGLPLMIAVSEEYYSDDWNELFKFLVNYGADYENILFVNFLKRERISKVDNFLRHYNLVKHDACLNKHEKISKEILTFAVEKNYPCIVKIFLFKEVLPDKKLLASIPKDITTKQLRKLLVNYLRLSEGPYGVYTLQKNSESEEYWLPDEKWGPISRTGILTMNAQDADTNEVVYLPKEVVLNIIKYVI